MNIIISNSSEQPIYEQIKIQIKNMIMTGELKAGDLLPGMRSLAKELKISVITTKRAYNDLETEGYICTVAGRGCFVKSLNSDLIREENLKRIEEYLNKALEVANASGINSGELIEMLSFLIRGET
ncbi:GntR family transcriptional regulator [Peptoniphilus sp. oral taxon 386]|uniref:GntR family transcriptional regulator n=1 Tax=Peptoniphilus sp. oral taxon 386 TaxID=652713 RepID=UPI0001DA9A02|nr:GntR family transcriptional regulator [Peptoniphilus sp. oral taxon 386]EFI41820.1 transcriptional regulator, GntR family [Peptoniphilus sp. oral taxon 386 str. F0131]